MMDAKALNTLLKRTKEGDGTSFSALCEEYMPLIEAQVASVSKGDRSLRDDLMQEARLALYHAACSFRAGQDVTFGLYAKICIHNALVSHMRAGNKLNHICSLDELTESGYFSESAAENGDTALNRMIDREDEEARIRQIEAALSDFELCVFRQYMAGLSAAEIATALGKTRKSVENALQRGIAKLKNILR